MSLTARPRLHASYQSVRFREEPGFTLLEIMVAVTILSVIALVVLSSFRSVLNSVERVQDEQTQLRIANFLVTHFEENISGAYMPGTGNLTGGRFDDFMARGGGGFVGEDQEIDGRPADTLTFYTTAARMGGGALPGDTKRVSYALREDEDGRYRLLVYEAPYLLLPMTGEDEEVDTTTASWSVRMASLDFKYFDGAEWVDSWKSAQMGLPCGVRIEAHFVEEELRWLMDEAGAKEPVLIMVVNIPLGQPRQT